MSTLASGEGGVAPEQPDDPGAGWSRSSAWKAIAATFAVAVALCVAFSLVAPSLGAAQRSQAPVVNVDGLQTGVLLDMGFAVAYTLFGVLVFSLFRKVRAEERGAWRPAAAAGAWMVVAGGLADLVENAIITADLQDWLGTATEMWNVAKLAAGVVKFALLAAAAMALVVVVVTRDRKMYPVGDSHDRPRPTDGTPPAWDPPKPGNSRLGVCLSGGGIRSAAFCLGGVQALQDKGVLAKAEYLAAASGGGYLAAGWAVADAQSPATAPGQAWSRGSPEERWFRDNSSYLIPDLLGGMKGVGRLLGGVVVNFLLIWLLVFLLGRPIGWVIGATHPELKLNAETGEVALARDGKGAMVVDRVEPRPAMDAVVDGTTVRANRYAVFLKPDRGPDDMPRADPNQVCFDTAAFNPGDRQFCFGVDQVEDRPAIVEVKNGQASVVVQPKVELTLCLHDPPKAPGELCPPQDTASIAELCRFGAALATTKPCRLYEHLEFASHPKVSVKTPAVHEPVPADQLKVSVQAQVRSTGGLADRPGPTYKTWMWEGSLGLVLAGGLAALVVMGGRLRGRAEGIWRSIALSLVLTGLTCLLITIILPALAIWIPKFAARIPGTDVEVGDAVLPSGGLIAITAAAARQYLTGSKKGSGTGPAGTAGPEKQSKGPLGKLHDALTGTKEQLSWYEVSPWKVLMGLLLLVGFVVSFVAQLQYSIPNGPGGRLIGVSFVRDRLPYWAWAPEYARFLLVAGLLLAFAATVDAHAWSLYPFYKRQLSRAYILRRAGRKARPIPYGELLPFSNEPGPWNGLRTDAERSARPGPKLVLCCAVNLSESGVVPPGRRASSFTFDADYIGGPLVGYRTAQEYWANLPASRRRDITIPSAMAISGAAFSPAMGKQNLGPVGSVLALANLRLGVWLPHPRAVAPANVKKWGRLQRPGWMWYLREVCNSYGFHRRYLYVSDGGHWDNLGLVELLRRGCTDIICISAAGDGTDSFGTIAEAIALAREELGVDIALDPSTLRPPVKAAAPAPQRELRRKTNKTKADHFAKESFVVSSYRWSSGTATGRILYIETALTPDLPFDVHGFAESEAVFPDDSTADQVFNHRQFEAFRALGYHQVFSAILPPDAGVPGPG